MKFEYKKMDRNSLLCNFQNNYYQILAAFSASMILISDGMHYAWTAPVIPILLSKNSPIPITKTDVVWIESVYLLSGVVFLPFTIMLVDNVGRRRSILIASIMHASSWLFLLFANRVEYLYVARSISGMADDLCFVVTPVYISEISGEKMRGFLSSTVIIMMLMGYLIIYSVAPFVTFYIPSIIGLCIACTHLVIFTFMPESPYYFLLKNKTLEAKTALNILRPNQDNDVELETMRAAIEEQQQNKGKVRDLFLKKRNLKCVGIGAVLLGGQQLCGFSVILMNIHTILSKSNDGNVYFSSSTTAILFSVVMLVSSIIASIYIDRYGRKVLIIISAVFTALCLFALAIYFHFRFLGYSMDNFNLIPVVSVAVYALVFKIGLGLIPIILMAEMYPTNVKTIGMCFGDILYLLFAYISIEFYQRISDAYGIHVVFYSFACFTSSIAIFTYLVVPETRGKTLEEIQTLMKGTPSSRARIHYNT